MTHSEAIDKFLNAIQTAAIPACDVWSADATLDATVPNWRFHVSGADAIRTEYARWFADPGQFRAHVPREEIRHRLFNLLVWHLFPRFQTIIEWA